MTESNSITESRDPHLSRINKKLEEIPEVSTTENFCNSNSVLDLLIFLEVVVRIKYIRHIGI